MTIRIDWPVIAPAITAIWLVVLISGLAAGLDTAWPAASTYSLIGAAASWWHRDDLSHLAGRLIAAGQVVYRTIWR